MYYWYQNDHLGTPQKIIAENGAVVWSARYDGFGGAVVGVETVVNHLRFPGQYFDAETGLHYNWHRFYDPATGRYISADPIGLDGGINLYAYVQNDPVNFIDPEGLFIFTATFGITAWALAGDAAIIGSLWWALNESIDKDTDMTDPSTWPDPPVEGECTEGDPSRSKPRKRGEKSDYDEQGGEWRPHKPDKYHPEGHWDHKPSSPNSPWTNVPVK
ncbi:MAG TPA: hypothetical protein EYH19_07865 [Desulfocapsa sulfexigens]|nr:hypothetical protein [Desulfocapsa sulfexigens]